jgi:hypothetical protein
MTFAGPLGRTYPREKEEYVHNKYEYQVDKIIRFHSPATSSEGLTTLK